MVLLADSRSIFKGLFSVAILFLLTQGVLCPGPESFRVPDVEINELRLTVFDTVNMAPGVRIKWDFPESGGERVSHFSIYYKEHSDSSAILEKTPIPVGYRELLLKLPDSLGDSVIYGMKAVYVASTGQTWESDSICWAVLFFSPAVSDLLPTRNSSDTNIKTVFRLRPGNDNGETYRFFAFQKNNDSLWVAIDTTFPFNWAGNDFFPGGGFVVDSLQLKFFGRKRLDVKWCILATQSPGKDLTRLKQSLTCSQFYKEML